MKNIKTARMLLASVAFICTLNTDAQTGWGSVPSTNTMLTGSGLGNTAQMSVDISAIDDANNMYAVTWHDGRSGATNYNIYAQCVSSAGAGQWTSNGLGVCTSTGMQIKPKITSNNVDAFFIAWEDSRNGNTDIYMQRINANGTVAWTSNGIPVAVVCGTQASIEIKGLANGDVLVSWVDERNGDKDIYAQIIDGTTGTAEWKTNGLLITPSSGDQLNQKMAENSNNDIVFVWEDATSGDIYGQLFDDNGFWQWGPKTGVQVCANASGKKSPQVVASGADCFVSWIDDRSSSLNPYYIMLDAVGAPITTSTGTIAFSGGGNAATRTIHMVSDRASGMYLAWDDYRNAYDYDIYAQRVLSSGSISTLWPAAGAVVCDDATNYNNLNPQIAACDGELTATFGHQVPGSLAYEIYYQKLLSNDGSFQSGFNTNGTALCSMIGIQWKQKVTIMRGYAVAAWEDNRNNASTGYDVFCSEMANTCNTAPTTTSFVINTNNNGQNGEKAIAQYDLSHDASVKQVTITHPAKTETVKLTIMASDGKTVKEINGFKPGNSVDVSDLGSGTYIIKLSGSDQTMSILIP